MTNKNFYNDDSVAIEWLRFPLIVCVVFIHSFGPSVDMSLIDWQSLTGQDVYDILRVFFSRIVTHSAVPCFYFISGYLFFLNVKHFDKNVYASKIRKRMRTLLVPYLLWNIIFIFAISGKMVLKGVLGMAPLSDVLSWFTDNGGIAGLFWNCNVWGETAVNWLGKAQRSSGPIDLPLWFLRDLIVVTALTPAIYWLMTRCGKLALAVLGLAFASKVWPVMDGFSIAALFFFSIGAYMGVHKTSLSAVKKYQTPIYIITVVLILADTYLGGPDTHFGDLVHPFARAFGMFALICLSLTLHDRGHVKWPMLSKAVFFIYALHGLYIVSYYSGDAWSELVENCNVAVKTIVYFLVPFLKIAACLVAFALMERYTPKLLALLTGNRS